MGKEHYGGFSIACLLFSRLDFKTMVLILDCGPKEGRWDKSRRAFLSHARDFRSSSSGCIV